MTHVFSDKVTVTGTGPIRVKFSGFKEEDVRGYLYLCMKEFMEDGQSYTTFWLENHKFPAWMSVTMHVTLEDIIMRIFEDRASLIPSLRILYDFLMGIVCGYSMREIIGYIRNDQE